MLLLWLACAPGKTTDTAGENEDTGDAVDTAPVPPPGLERWLSGDEADATVTPAGPLVVVAGGGGDVDAAMRAMLSAASGGDVVVLRTSGEDGYNGYFFAELGVSVNSVETLRVDTPALADDPYVAWRLETAEAVFIAGGDQSTYLAAWEGTATQAALRGLWARGAVLGGTSAGAAVLGQRVFSASAGTIYSHEALSDPYGARMAFADGFLSIPVLEGVVTDTHFYERDRMGRLVGFVARAVADGLGDPFVGLGVDEGTAVVVGADGAAEVLGDGYAYVVEGTAPEVCVPGEPLTVSEWRYHVVHPGDTLQLSAGSSDGPAYTLSVSAGRLQPKSPY